MISAGVLKFSAFYLFVKRLIICTACLLLQELHTTDDNNKPTNFIMNLLWPRLHIILYFILVFQTPMILMEFLQTLSVCCPH